MMMTMVTTTARPESSTPTEAQLHERHRRVALVEALEAMLARGMSLRRAAQELREPVATLSRYRQQYQAGGAEALTPSASTGRPAKFTLSESEMQALRLEVLKRGSFALAVEWFGSSAQCSAGTARLIREELDRAARNKREPQWPDSLRRAAAVRPEEEALFRSKKAAQGIEMCDRRGLEWIDEEGRRQPLLPNTVWESDDMSANEPFRWLAADGSRCLGRQTLCTIDVYAAHWLGASPIGRARDAYRAEDIADHMLECVQLHGLPTIWRLERGAWENTFIDGVRIVKNQRGGPGQGSDDADEERWGGLSALFTISRAWKSRQKGLVESSFDLLQSMMAHESLSIGRVRGEFEAATKAYLRADKDPAAWVKFWDIAAAADGMRRAMEEFNGRPKKRRMFGRDMVVPADLYRQAVRRPCPADQLWRFCPVKRAATVRRGCIEVSVDHYPLPFRFRVNGESAEIYCEHGYPVFIAFHPGHPERGCHVFNAERGLRNRDGWKFGEHLLIAAMAPDAPQVNLAPEDREFAARKRANAAVRSEFRGIVTAGGVQTPGGRQASTVRDGWGNSARIERGGETDDFTRSRSRKSDEGRAELRSIGRKTTPEDEDEILAQLDREEAAAIERGELVTTFFNNQ